DADHLRDVFPRAVPLVLLNSIQKNRRISSGVEGIGEIKIQKRIDLINVPIYMGYPKLLMAPPFPPA
ncbi:hypothetical protein J8J17_24170, partial [Mycobacterium tuberculosis]|nr:hypothetical protein [Mycobacterium tuberculosis]